MAGDLQISHTKGSQLTQDRRSYRGIAGGKRTELNGLEPASPYQLQDEHDDSDQNQDMYEVAAYVHAKKAQCPQDQEDNRDRPKHMFLLL
jgi:hypothetical protein